MFQQQSHDFGPRTKAQVTSSIGRRSCPVGYRFLIRETDQQRVLCTPMSSCGSQPNAITCLSRSDTRICLAMVGVVLAPVRLLSSTARVDVHTVGFIPVINPRISYVDQQILAKVVMRPDTKRLTRGNQRCCAAP